MNGWKNILINIYHGVLNADPVRSGRGQMVGVKDGGEDLRDIGAEASVLVRFCLLLFVFGGSLAAGDGRIEGGGRVLRTQVLAGDGCAGLVIDEDLVMRVSICSRSP